MGDEQRKGDLSLFGYLGGQQVDELATKDKLITIHKIT